MKSIAAGIHHSVGITQAGECLVWGRLDSGQLGIDVQALPLNDPTQIVLDLRQKPRILLHPKTLPIKDCVHIGSGTDHSIVITGAGKAYSWGFNTNFQCGQGSGNEPEDILVAKLIDGKDTREKKWCWTRAGRQYSILASESEQP